MTTPMSPTVAARIKKSLNEVESRIRKQVEARPVLRPTQVVPRSANESAGQRSGISYQAILSPTIQYELYNPSDEPMEFGYGGETYVLPGNSDLWVGVDGRSGQLMEYSRPGVLPVFGRPEVKIDAITIVRHAVGEDGRGGHVGVNGVRLLFDDPERDAEVMAEARESWVEKKRFDCEAQIRAHEADVQMAITQRREPPRPPRRVREAYNWVQNNERAGGIKVSCPVCYDGFPEDRDMQIHLVTFHKKHALAAAAREALDMEEDLIEKEETDEARPQPRKQRPLPKSLKSAGKILAAAARGEEPPEDDDDEDDEENVPVGEDSEVVADGPPEEDRKQ